MRRLNTLLVAGIGFALLASNAAAWGPKARKAISYAALQVIRQEFPDVFKAEISNYETDIFRGAEDGYSVVKESLAIEKDSQAIIAIAHEIQLLRAVREDGTGSYFAYRNGVLAGLIADAILPHGIAYLPSDAELKVRIDTDLESQLDELRAVRTAGRAVFLRNVSEYFREQRLFFADDSKMIRDDYKRGRGGSGLLGEAAQDYFSRSVEAVVNAWYTILTTTVSAKDVLPSPPILTEYSVNEIAYLLDVKENFEQANRAYRVFSRVNNGRGMPYETVGDLYYAFGVELAVQEAKERGVAEWKIARRTQGPQRKRSNLKLSRHYISEGADALLKGLGPTATDADLKNALRNFEQALEYDGKSELAADKISETQRHITERAKDYKLQNSVLSTSRKVSQEAEKSRADEGFVTAIDTYQRATGLLDAINERFPDLSSAADSERKGIQNAIRDIIDDVLDRADILLEEGDTALAASNFDVAVAAYGKVPGLLEGIPVDPGSPDENSIQSAIERAAEKIVETEAARMRAEELKKQQGLPGGGPQGGPGNR